MYPGLMFKWLSNCLECFLSLVRFVVQGLAFHIRVFLKQKILSLDYGTKQMLVVPVVYVFLVISISSALPYFPTPYTNKSTHNPPSSRSSSYKSPPVTNLLFSFFLFPTLLTFSLPTGMILPFSLAEGSKSHWDLEASLSILRVTYSVSHLYLFPWEQQQPPKNPSSTAHLHSSVCISPHQSWN